MKNLLIIIILLIVNFNCLAQIDLSKIDPNLMALTVSKNSCDTINFSNRLLSPDNKLVFYTSNWCCWGYKELNQLYSEGVIDYAINQNYSLIFLASKYPFIFLNSPQIKGEWNKRIQQDFEVFYEMQEGKIVKSLTGGNGHPVIFIIKDGKAIKQSIGYLNNHSDILEILNDQK